MYLMKLYIIRKGDVKNIAPMHVMKNTGFMSTTARAFRG